MKACSMHLFKLLLLFTLMLAIKSFAGVPSGLALSQYVYPGADGKLIGAPYNEQGDRVPDFSHCGYQSGNVSLPQIPIKKTLSPDSKIKDDTERIQKAIDELSRLPMDSQGFRGTLLLTPGRYQISGSIHVTASGIVIRGEKNKTVLQATGNHRRTLIQIHGDNGPVLDEKTRQKITTSYVSVGANEFTVNDTSAFQPGDTIIVARVGNQDWIHEIKMDVITPRPDNPRRTHQWNPFTIYYDRIITSIQDNRIRIDAPVTCSIDQRWGGGWICKYEDSDRIENVGVENLSAISDFDRQVIRTYKEEKYFADERHAEYLVSFNNVKNAWALNLRTKYFAHGISYIGETAKWITVQDCDTAQPVSLLTGGRRYPYVINGQLCLVRSCTSAGARHAFVFGAWVSGPNVFLKCHSKQNYAYSEPHHRWSTGGLYDNVIADIAVQDRQWMGSGHGWAGANYVLWNCDGEIICQQPPTAQNLAIGCTGRRKKGVFERPDGIWESFGQNVFPQSLYLHQLKDREGTRTNSVRNKPS